MRAELHEFLSELDGSDLLAVECDPREREDSWAPESLSISSSSFSFFFQGAWCAINPVPASYILSSHSSLDVYL